MLKQLYSVLGTVALTAAALLLGVSEVHAQRGGGRGGGGARVGGARGFSGGGYRGGAVYRGGAYRGGAVYRGAYGGAYRGYGYRPYAGAYRGYGYRSSYGAYRPWYSGYRYGSYRPYYNYGYNRFRFYRPYYASLLFLGLGYGLGGYGYGYGGYGYPSYDGYPYSNGYGYGGYGGYGPSYDDYGPGYAYPPDPGAQLTPDAVQPPADNCIHLQLTVPENGEVLVDGAKTSQTGRVREFVSPALAPGQIYTYRITVRYPGAGGKMVEDTRDIRARPNDWFTVDFTRPAPAGQPPAGQPPAMPPADPKP
jgi:uncharacterized protein (TIGR03000 family)